MRVHRRPPASTTEERSHTPLCVSFATSPPASPTPSDDPDPPPLRAPDQADSPATSPTTDHHIFAVYQRDTAVYFIPDSGATHILIRESDADILSSVVPFPPYTRKPHFEVANKQFIVPFASGVIAFPNSDVTLRAYIFRDHDLADNLFGIAPLLRHGYTATFTDNDFSISELSPNSFRITAIFFPWFSVSTQFTSVVFPEPFHIFIKRMFFLI